VNSRNMIRMAALSVACLLEQRLSGRRGPRWRAPPAGQKPAVINVRQAIVSTAEGKLASAELQSQFAPRQNELENLNKQVNDLRQQLAANQTTWSDEQKAKAQTQGQRLAAQLDRKEQRTQRGRAGRAGRSGGPHRAENDGRAGPLFAGKRICGGARYIGAEFADSVCVGEYRCHTGDH